MNTNEKGASSTHEADHERLVAWRLTSLKSEGHAYTRCAFSGAGNCCCGSPVEWRWHPHEFTPMRVDPLRCVCLLSPNWRFHTTATGEAGESRG